MHPPFDPKFSVKFGNFGQKTIWAGLLHNSTLLGAQLFRQRKEEPYEFEGIIKSPKDNMILFERRKYISAKEEDATIELKIAAIRQGQSKQQATLNTKQLLFF